MSYCFNPHCSQPNNDARDECHTCGASLLIQKRYRGDRLLGKSQLALTLEVTDTKQHKSDIATRAPATKVMKILLSDYPKAVELFQQEARILAEVDREGIPKLATNGYFSFQPCWSENPVSCLVIEKITGLDLEKWSKQQDEGRINEAKALDWLKQLLNILEQLHQQQYFHRDIKPSNIILQPNGKLVLIDFGAARKVTATYLSKVGVNRGITSIGTPGYVAPEQIDGAALPQSDFFGLGRTMIHLLTGKHPQELPKDVNTGGIIWRDLVPQISVSFADLLDSMTDRFPGKRPINIKAINDALSKVEQFPHRSLNKSNSQLKLSRSIILSIIFLPLSVLGLFSLGNSLQQRVANNKITNDPLCNNLTCVNRDPIDNNCDRDMQTITSNTGNYRISRDLVKAYRLEVRFSAVCEATWAKSEAPPDSVHYLEDTQGKQYGSAVVPVDQFQEHYADMGPGKNVEIRACAEPPTGKKSCTNFVKL